MKTYAASVPERSRRAGAGCDTAPAARRRPAPRARCRPAPLAGSGGCGTGGLPLDDGRPIAFDDSLDFGDARGHGGQETAGSPGAVDRRESIATDRGVYPARATACRGDEHPRGYQDGRRASKMRRRPTPHEGEGTGKRQSAPLQWQSIAWICGTAACAPPRSPARRAGRTACTLRGSARSVPREDVRRRSRRWLRGTCRADSPAACGIASHPQGVATATPGGFEGSVISLRTRGPVHEVQHPQTQPTISASAISMPITSRHRLRRTRLMGWFHFSRPSARAAGAAIKVNGQTIRETSGSVSTTESYNGREVSSFASRAAPAPAAMHDGHHVSPANSTAQMPHTNRPHWRHAATARLTGWSKQAASPSSAASAWDPVG